MAEFWFNDRREVIWLVLERHDVSVCPEDPHLPVDLVVEGTAPDLYRVYIGRTTLQVEREAGRISIGGRPGMVRAFPRWMEWSTFVSASRRSMSGRAS